MQDELEVFKMLKDIKVIFDVGARTDTFYHKIVPEAEVHYFEPNEDFAQQLSGGYVNNFGLSDKNEISIYYPRTQSFVIPMGVGRFYELKTLDEYAKNIPRIDFLKIDAEGMDYRILLGGEKTLKKIRYIQFEYWDGVKKFVDLLTDFDLFLISDSRLYEEAIRKNVDDSKYENLLVPMTPDVIDVIDNICIPMRCGGNVLAIKK